MQLRSSHCLITKRFNFLSFSSFKLLTCHFHNYSSNWARKMTSPSPLELNPSDPKIQLNTEETKIRNLVVEFCDVFNKSNPDRDPVVLRITGGWVRDKLLGLNSNDIDIGINNLTGLEFAESLKEYMTKHAERLGVKIKGIHKIEKNPEKSKHLETATTNLYGLDVDFVNLRCEQYAEDSRIPTMQFGTPTQDAFRRDATLNALFYNLQEQTIEDFTGRGLQDLKNGILRTPLDPLETFKDDPLRVLRLIRFSAKFGFPIADNTLDAMRHKDIKTDLIRKISRERIGVEVSKMLAPTTKYPEKGLFAIAFLQLEEAIFYLDPQRLATKLPQSNLTELTRVARDLEANKQVLHPDLQKQFFSNSKHRYTFWLSVPLTQFDGLETLNRKENSVSLVIRAGLKLPIQDYYHLSEMFNLKEQFWEASQVLASAGDISRKKLGLLIRKGKDWKLNLIYSLFWRLSLKHEVEKDLVLKYNTLVSKIVSLGLDTAISIKPLINGKEIMELFNTRGGPWTSLAVQSVIEMQLENPQATKEQISEQLLELKSTFFP